MKPIKYLLAALLIGIIIGGAAYYSYDNVSVAEEKKSANELTDFIIAEWTHTDPSSPLLVSPEGGENELAQFGARKELPMSRLGYFPDTVKILAEIVEARYKVPAAVTLAQWALESGFGKNNLGVSNYFGHTYGATGKFSSLKKFVLRTENGGFRRTLKFTVYKNIEECFEAHGKYLSTSQHYRAAFYTSTPENFVRAMSVYAEDGEYVVKLIAIMRRYKL